jgi:hypothetical protein
MDDTSREESAPPAGRPGGSAERRTPRFKPREGFWPYVDPPEEPTDEELAALDPDLRTALFGSPELPFSLTIRFPEFDGEDYTAAVQAARSAGEYRETSAAGRRVHLARFWPSDAEKLRDLWRIVGGLDAAEVLVDDRPVPYARELWLPLFWFLVRRS